MSDFPISFIRTQAKLVGDCFRKSVLLGIDSDDFAKKFMTSKYGIMVVTDKRMIEYSDSGFMLEGFTRNLTFVKGLSYNEDILWLTGYLYKYWVSTRKASPQKVYELAPIVLIAERYEFYHTQDFDYIINDLINRPFRKGF